MGFVLKVVVNALALAVAAWLVDGIRLTSSTEESQFVTLLVVGLIFGVVNAFVRPIVTLLSLPFIILTLGLLSFVINALMLEIVDWASNSLGIAFDSGPFFWSTLGAAVIVTLVSMILSVMVPEKRD